VTPARKARACTAAAVVWFTAAAIATPLNPIAAIAGLAGGILATACAGSYRTEARHAARAALPAIPYPDPQPMPDWEQAAEQARYDEAFDTIRRHYDHGTAA
jgi:hypothetical protein